MFVSSLPQRQARDLFEPRDRGLVFGQVLPVVLVQVQNVQERCQHRLEILFVRLVGGEASLKCGQRLRRQSFPVNLQQLRRLLRDYVLCAQSLR